MPGTPATFASYCDPASPASASSHHPHSRSNSLVAKMDMEIGLVGAGGGCNDSDDGGVGGPSGTKSLLMSKTTRRSGPGSPHTDHARIVAHAVQQLSQSQNSANNM